jgi:uncharacterized protein (TIGR02678 family)
VADDPHTATERRLAARHLLQRPLTCAEHDPDVFHTIRRHEAELDRWFTQRLGYRLHVDADTARLYKAGVLVEHRPLRTTSGRPLHHTEYVLLCLVLASTAAGPGVISLRDLVDGVRSAAAEVEITLDDDGATRRALVTVLRWMIDHGLASEMHARVEAYASDEDADAVLKMRPDRIALLPMPTSTGVADAADLLARADRRSSLRQWMRGRLAETPVLYRSDLDDEEWGELRRRIGEEERVLGEMFDLLLESRAEGVASIDPSGALSQRRFPSAGTVGHAALLFLEAMDVDVDVPIDTVITITAGLVTAHARSWSNDYVASPERLARAALELLVDVRLAVIRPDPERARLLPAAARFRVVVPGGSPAAEQDALW